MKKGVFPFFSCSDYWVLGQKRGLDKWESTVMLLYIVPPTPLFILSNHPSAPSCPTNYYCLANLNIHRGPDKQGGWDRTSPDHYKLHCSGVAQWMRILLTHKMDHGYSNSHTLCTWRWVNNIPTMCHFVNPTINCIGSRHTNAATHHYARANIML